jgi:hypothetical protein
VPDRFKRAVQKYFSFLFSEIRNTCIRPASMRGVRVVTDFECGMRWTQHCRGTNDSDADGEAVWSWRPVAGAKLATMHSHRADDGDNKVWFTEESAE